MGAHREGSLTELTNCSSGKTRGKRALVYVTWAAKADGSEMWVSKLSFSRASDVYVDQGTVNAAFNKLSYRIQGRSRSDHDNKVVIGIDSESNGKSFKVRSPNAQTLRDAGFSVIEASSGSQTYTVTGEADKVLGANEAAGSQEIKIEPVATELGKPGNAIIALPAELCVPQRSLSR